MINRQGTIAAAMVFAALLAATTPVRGGTVTISDGDFVTTDWNSIVSGSSASVSLASTGGDPGAYRRMTHTVAPDSSVTVYHFYEAATYDPGASGAITSIDYSEDRIQFDPPFANAKVGSLFLILQEGEGIFFATQDLSFGNTTWSTATLTGLESTDFGKVSGAGSLDFSASGGKMTFGYLRSNTNDPNGDTWTTTHGIDDFTVTVHNTAVVPLPASTWLGLGLLGVMGAVRRIRRRRGVV